MTSFRKRPRVRGALPAVMLALGMLSLPTQAQTPPPTPAPAAPPKPDCGAKPEHPGRLGSDTQQRQWRKDANAYLECYKKFATDQRAVAQQCQDTANAVIDEYNAAVKDLQAAADAAAQPK